MKWVETGFIVLALVLAVVVCFNPVVYDTLHVNDSTFMLQVSDWVRRGEVPGIDFPHFYGGVHEAFVALGLELSGGSVKALDYARVLQFGVLVVVLGMIAWQRLDTLTTSLLLLLFAVILFAALPFEERPYVGFPNIESAHSFAYNRWTTCLALVCAVVLNRPSSHRLAEIGGGVIAGMAATAAILTKVTFFPIFLAMVMGLALTARWKTLIAFIVAGVALGVAMDPTGARTIGVLIYSMESTGTGASESWLLRKAIQLVFAHNAEVLAFLVAFAMVFISLPRGRAVRLVASGLLLLAAFWASAVTMGPAGLVGHQASPFIAGMILLLLPDLERPEIKGAGVVLLCVVYVAFVGPHMLNLAGATYASIRNADQVAFSSGPLSGYLARGSWRATGNGEVISLRADPRAAVAATAERLASIEEIDATASYVLLFDAVELLHGLDIPRGYGVVSDTSLGIGFAVGADRSEGFPAWPRQSSQEFRDGSDPLRGASVVLVMRARETSVQSAMRPFLSDERFMLCRESLLWRAYALRAHHDGACS